MVRGRRVAAVVVLLAALQACRGDPSSKAISDAVPDAAPNAVSSTAVAPDRPGTSAPGRPSFGVPAQLATGKLAGLVGHRGSGEAAVWRQPDGSLIVRLEAFEVSDVSGLSVYLVAGAAIDKPDGGVRLGALASNRGTANLPIPAGTSLNYPVTVLIWSDASRLPIAHATETPV